MERWSLHGPDLSSRQHRSHYIWGKELLDHVWVDVHLSFLVFFLRKVHPTKTHPEQTLLLLLLVDTCHWFLQGNLQAKRRQSSFTWDGAWRPGHDTSRGTTPEQRTWRHHCEETGATITHDQGDEGSTGHSAQHEPESPERRGQHQRLDGERGEEKVSWAGNVCTEIWVAGCGSFSGQVVLRCVFTDLPVVSVDIVSHTWLRPSLSHVICLPLRPFIFFCFWSDSMSLGLRSDRCWQQQQQNQRFYPFLLIPWFNLFLAWQCRCVCDLRCAVTLSKVCYHWHIMDNWWILWFSHSRWN